MDLSTKKRQLKPPTPFIKRETIYEDLECFNYIPQASEYYTHPHYPPFYQQVSTTASPVIRSYPTASPNPVASSDHNVNPCHIVSSDPNISPNHVLSSNPDASPNSVITSSLNRLNPNPVASTKLTKLSPNPAMSPNSDSGHSESSKVSSSDTVRDFNCNSLGPATSFVKNCSRPFKAIDPLSLALGGIGVSRDSADAYAQFRQRMLAQVQTQYSGTNKNMRRSMNTLNTQTADPSYLEKRKRNNEAAKRSRDARRAKEDEIAIRCAFLEQENIRLKLQLAAIEKQKKILLSLTNQH